MRTWDDAAAALDAALRAARPRDPAATLLAADTRAALAALERTVADLRAGEPCAVARADDAGLGAALLLEAQARLWADWERAEASAPAPDLATALRDAALGAHPSGLVGDVAGGVLQLAGLVARFEARRGSWRGSVPAYVQRMAETALGVAVALAALRQADDWPT